MLNSPPRQLGPELCDLLNEYRDLVAQLIRRDAGVVLLRFESVDDLLQGVLCGALRSAGDFTYRGRAEFVAWLKAVVRGYLNDRRDYWFALKRNRGRVLRLTLSGLDPDRGRRFNGQVTTSAGPATRALRREQLTLVTTALAAMPERDRHLIRWTSEDVDIADQARRLGLSAATARRARDRAVARLRKMLVLLEDH